MPLRPSFPCRLACLLVRNVNRIRDRLNGGNGYYDNYDNGYLNSGSGINNGNYRPTIGGSFNTDGKS